MKNGIKIIGLIIAIVMVITSLSSCALMAVGAIASAASNDDDNVSVNETKTETKVATNTNKKKTNFDVGETYTISNKGIVTYNNCEIYEEDNMFLEPKDGYKYIMFSFTFENTTSSEKYFYYDFECYADGVKVDRNYMIDNDLYLGDNIGAGRKVIGNICFEIPENTTTIELEYEPSYNTTIIFNGK